MNYIPGFSNYMETSVPEYGPAPIMAAEPVVPQRAAVMPMTQEAVAPYDLSGLDSLYGMNFGTDFGGGAMGGQYQADPNLQYIGAPLSNKGNATSRTGGNTFAVRADQPVRLVDHRTNQVVFEGTGFDAARKATELGQGLTDQFGRKANYSIQTADPSGNYSTVAYEKKNKSTLGQIADVAGTVAPLALGFVPGFGQLGLLAKMGAAAGAGGLGAALKGDNILKGALLGGATAGVVSGTGLDKALGSALGGISKSATQGITQGAAQAGGQAGGQAAGDIVVKGLSKGLQAAGGALGQAALSQAGNAAARELSGYKTPAEKFAEQPVTETVQPPLDDTIVVSGSRLRPAVPSYGDALAGVVSPIATEFLPKSVLPEPLPSEPQTAPKEEIVVTAPKSVLPPPPILGVETALPVITGGALTAAQTAGTPPENKLTAKDIADYLRLASLGVSTVGGLLEGGGGGSGSGGTIPAGMGALSSLFNKQLPTSTLPSGVSGGALPASTLASQGLRSPQDYYRYGYGPQQSFFDYVTQGAPNTSRAYTGYEGSTAEDAFAPQPMRAPQVSLPQVSLPQPITTPVPNNPAGPSMYAPAADNMRFAHGGYAVEGAGDGRDDKIPALLSDGEYVIDAETVALLGNGSNKAGAELLDNFRVNVRKQKGKKLARGEFSDNAKRPEHYMAGGYA